MNNKSNKPFGALDPRQVILDEYERIEEVYSKLLHTYQTTKHRNAVSKGIFAVRDEYRIVKEDPTLEIENRYLEALDKTIALRGLSRDDFK